MDEDFFKRLLEPELKLYRGVCDRFNETYKSAMQPPYCAGTLEGAISIGLLALQRLNSIRNMAGKPEYMLDEAMAVRKKVDELREIRTNPDIEIISGSGESKNE